MTDPTGKGFFDDVTEELIDVLEEHGDGIVDVQREQWEEVDQNGEKITIKGSKATVSDPESGAKIVKDEVEITGEATERQVSGRFRVTSAGADTGTLLGDDAKAGVHGPEVDAYGSFGEGKFGAGGHFDLVGGDVRVGDDGTHVQGGLSVGLGLGFEFATGEDTDGDGYGEWGYRGEAGPASGSVRLEPGAVADVAGETYDEASQAATQYYDELTADEQVDEYVIAAGVDQTGYDGAIPEGAVDEVGQEYGRTPMDDREFEYVEPTPVPEHEPLVEPELSYDGPNDDTSGYGYTDAEDIDLDGGVGEGFSEG